MYTDCPRQVSFPSTARAFDIRYLSSLFLSPSSLNCDDFILYLLLYVCVSLSLSPLFSRLRLHLNEQWHWMLHVCACVCVWLLLENAKNILDEWHSYLSSSSSFFFFFFCIADCCSFSFSFFYNTVLTAIVENGQIFLLRTAPRITFRVQSRFIWKIDNVLPKWWSKEREREKDASKYYSRGKGEARFSSKHRMSTLPRSSSVGRLNFEGSI